MKIFEQLLPGAALIASRKRATVDLGKDVTLCNLTANLQSLP